jgi:hypothetical protein
VKFGSVDIVGECFLIFILRVLVCTLCGCVENVSFEEFEEEVVEDSEKHWNFEEGKCP